LKETHLSLPVSESDVRRLRVGDRVFMSGIINTMRDMAHRRTIGMLEKGEVLPFRLSEGAIWHCGPIARRKDQIWQILAAGPTSSSRFTELGAQLVTKLHVRITIGKGTMGEEMVIALRDVGGIYLLATGGCAVLYARQISEVANVHWLDLGMPEAVWVLNVNRLGPLVVGIDSIGNIQYEITRKNASKSIEDIYEQEGVDVRKTCVWWPKKAVGLGDRASQRQCDEATNTP